MNLSDARVVLTGASGGLGQELARALAARGAHLLLVGRDAARLQALAAELRQPGKQVEQVAADLNQAEAVARLAAAARTFNANVLINNAGVLAFSLFEHQDWADAERVLDTNLRAPMRLTRALLPGLLEQPEAAVLNVGSTFGSLPFPGFAAYATAKAGLRAFSQALRRELADRRVQVVYVAPRAVDTPLNPPAVVALNQDLGSHSDPPGQVARRIVAALAAGRAETHLGFPEGLFAWINGALPRLIDGALASKLARVRRHAPGKEHP
jgi:short-subunit dehydrogenase